MCTLRVLVAKGARNRPLEWQKGNKEEESENARQLCGRYDVTGRGQAQCPKTQCPTLAIAFGLAF